MKKYDISAKKLDYANLFQYDNENVDSKELAIEIQKHFEKFKTTKQITFKSESGLFTYKECEKITKSFNEILTNDNWGKRLTDLLKPVGDKNKTGGYNYVDKTGMISIAVIDTEDFIMLHETYIGTFINNARKYISNFPYTFYFVEGGSPKIENNNLIFDFDQEKRSYYIFRQRIPNMIKLSTYLNKISGKEYDEKAEIASSISLQYQSCENLMNILFKNFTIEQTLDTLYVNLLSEKIDIPFYETVEVDDGGYFGYWKSKKTLQRAEKFINTKVVLDIINYKDSSITIQILKTDAVISSTEKSGSSDIGILVMEMLGVNTKDQDVSLSFDRKSKVAFCNNEAENYQCKRLVYPCDFVEDELQCLINNIEEVFEDLRIDYKSIVDKINKSKNILSGITMNPKNYFRLAYLLNFIQNDVNEYYEKNVAMENKNRSLEKRMGKVNYIFSNLVKKLSKEDQNKIKCRMCIMKEVFLMQRYLRVYSLYYNDNLLYTNFIDYLSGDSAPEIKISVNKSGDPFFMQEDPIYGSYEEDQKFIAVILSGKYDYDSFDDFINNNQDYLLGIARKTFGDFGNLEDYPKYELKYNQDLILAVNPTDVSDYFYKAVKYVTSGETSILELEDEYIVSTINNVEL